MAGNSLTTLILLRKESSYSVTNVLFSTQEINFKVRISPSSSALYKLFFYLAYSLISKVIYCLTDYTRQQTHDQLLKERLA